MSVNPFSQEIKYLTFPISIYGAKNLPTFRTHFFTRFGLKAWGAISNGHFVSSHKLPTTMNEEEKMTNFLELDLDLLEYVL